MLKFITILTCCSLALAVGVQAEQENPEKPKPKTKQVQKQQVAPRQHIAPKGPVSPNNHVQTHTEHKNTTIPNNARIHEHNGPNQQLHTLPAVQSNKNNRIHNPGPGNNPNPNPVVQSNKIQANQHNVKKFQPKHMNFHAQQNSAIVSAKFNKNLHIKNAQNWKGSQYNAFKKYHPQWHDKGWWHSHHNHIVLIGGGWYFWNAGYWYPAWGYDDSAAYYPYDGPIYVGNDPKPFDQIVADVQSSLQEQGYYHGQVDGLVGPLTQEALAAYQSAQGLEATAAIDQPTLESLGIG